MTLTKTGLIYFCVLTLNLSNFVEAKEPSRSESDEIQTTPIYVTAQKRSQLASDVPISMTVLNEDALEKNSVKNLQEIQSLVPALSMENQSGYNVLTIRGVGGGGRNIGFDPRVGVYLDGVYVGQSQALLLPLFDTKQIEVLRGPQGQLFGRNTVAGAINITTQEPTKELSGDVRVRVGNHGTQENYALLSVPLSDKLFSQFSLASENRDGTTTNLFNGQKLDDLNNQMLRAKLLFEPEDHLKLSLSLDTSKLNQNPTFGEPITDLFGLPLPGGQLPKRNVNFSTTPRDKVNLSGINFTSEYQFMNGYKLTAILGYRNTQELKEVDNDYSPLDILHIHYKDRFDQSSEEIRVTSPENAHARYVVGFLHLNEEAKTDRLATVGMDANSSVLFPIPGIPNPLLLPFGPTMHVLPGARITNNGTVETDTSAIFGAVDYDLTQALTLNMGARYMNETKKVLFNLDGSSSGLFGIGNLANYRDKQAESKFLPMIGATFGVTNNLKLYAKYSEGFKSGGWNTEYLSTHSALNPRYSSESVDAYEIGLKGQSNDGGVYFNLAAFDSKFKNFQVFQFVDLGGGGTSIELRNAARAESRGIDADISMRATSFLKIGAKTSLMEAFYNSFDNCSDSGPISCTGHQLPYAPKFSSTLMADYDWPLKEADGKVNLHVEYNHQGKSYSDPVNNNLTQLVPSRELVNLRIAYLPNNSHWDYNLWVHNLFDSDAIASRIRDFLGNEIIKRVDPRFIGVEVKYNFY